MLSTRVSLQWPPAKPEEHSHTMVFTSPQDHYVDIRILKKHYPYTPEGDQSEVPFIEDVFEWCMAGIEKPIEGTNKIEFQCSIDSQPIAKAIKSGSRVEPGPPDIGAFSNIEGSLDRKEEGEMPHPDTGKVQPYVEIWRSLDPAHHSPIEEVREDPKYHVPCTVLEITDSERYTGKLIHLGQWTQGLIHDKTTNALHVIRSYRDQTGWTHLIKYNKTDLFPIDYIGPVGSTTTVNEYGFKWKCIEKVE